MRKLKIRSDLRSVARDTLPNNFRQDPPDDKGGAEIHVNYGSDKNLSDINWELRVWGADDGACATAASASAYYCTREEAEADAAEHGAKGLSTEILPVTW